MDPLVVFAYEGEQAPPLTGMELNVTAHPSAASVPITVLLYDGPLLCGFNVAVKELSCFTICVMTGIE